MSAIEDAAIRYGKAVALHVIARQEADAASTAAFDARAKEAGARDAVQAAKDHLLTVAATSLKKEHFYHIDALGTDPVETEKRIRNAILAAHGNACVRGGPLNP